MQNREIFRLRDKRTCLLIIIGKGEPAVWGDCLVKLYDNAAIRMTRMHVYNCCGCVSQVEVITGSLVKDHTGAFEKLCTPCHSLTSKKVIDVGNRDGRCGTIVKTSGVIDGIFGPIIISAQFASICHYVGNPNAIICALWIAVQF